MSQNNSKNEEDNKDDNDIAVVWDFENIRVADHYNLEYLLNNMDFYLQEIGRPVYRKVYDNLSSPKEIWDVFLNHRFDIRHTKRTRKNQLDFYLMSETIDYINKNPKIRTCVLITNDGDFTALVENLQKNSVKVILLHEDKCSIDLLNLVDVHVNIKNIKHKILQSIIKELILEKNVISLLLNKQEFKEIIYNMKDIIRYLINFYHIRSKLIFKEIFDYERLIKIVDSNIDYYFYDFYELLESVKPEILNVYLSDNNRLNKVEVDWNDLEEVLYFIEIVKKHNPAYLKEKKLIERLETSILNDKFDINQIHLLSHIEWFLKRIDTILGKDIGQKLFEKIKSYRKQLILKKIYLKEPEKDIVGHGRTFVDNFLRRLEFTHNQYPGVAISELIDYKEIRKITEIEESVLHLLKFIRFFNKNILDSRDKLINFETIKKRINDLIHEVFQLKELNQLHQINLWIVVDEGYISDCFKAIYELYKEEFEKFHFWNTIKSEFNFDFNFGRFYKIVYTLYEIKPDILVPFINIKDLKKYILKHQIEVFALGINYLNLFSEIYKLEDSEIAAEFEKFTENFKLLKK